MVTTRIFLSNTTQAVRLPKAVAFPEDVRDVEVTVIGNGRLITPVGAKWDWFFAEGPAVSEDFMAERDQPDMQERPGL
jgi:antitoxin VapB